MSRDKRETLRSAFSNMMSRGGIREEPEDEEVEVTTKRSGYKSTRPVLTFNRALEQAEFGRFNLWVLATCGGVVALMQLLPIYLIYKAPSVECDLQFHNDEDRHFLNSVVYAGLTLGALVTGIISDLQCRNLVLVSSLGVSLCGTLLIATNSSYTLLWLGRLLTSFGSSGAVVVAIVILAEYSPPQHRAAAICSVQLFWVMGTVAMPVLDLQWSTAALIVGALTIVLICSVLSLPENPRYLLTRGDNEGAYTTLRIMYAYNTGNRETDYLAQGVLDNESITQLRARVAEKLVPDYMKPRCYTFPLLVILQFFLMLSYYCLMTYFSVLPSRYDAFYEVKDYLHEGMVDSCALSDDRGDAVLQEFHRMDPDAMALNISSREIANTKNQTNLTSIDCFPESPQIYNELRLQEFVMVTFAAIPAIVWLVMSIDSQGRKFFLALAHVIAAALIYSSYFVMRTSYDLVFACGFEAMVTLSIAASQLLMIELAKTRCRASALGVLFFGGYMGLILGNWGLCMAMQISCNILLGILGILVSFSGGDVWVLVIKDAKPSDSGIYVCEVNSSPILQSFHKLSVLSRSLLPPVVNASTFDSQTLAANNHNYTDCCAANNVSQSCYGFCNIQSILEGNTGQDPENCEGDFPAIVRCMADGRNHVPCCIQEGVPDICQDVCRGEYTMITDNIKTHFSCSAYTEQTLACIVEGVELLPSPPEGVEVESLTEKSLNVSWRAPSENAESVAQYVVNVTALRMFDEDTELPMEPEDSYAAAAQRAQAERKTTPPPMVQPLVGTTIQIKVPSTYNSTLVQNLLPFTMYEITVTALNKHGSSLPSYAIRTLTLTPGKMKATAVAEAPELPDIKGCCIKKGISHESCVNKLCDPHLADIAGVTDLMICAPWAADTFGCLTNNIDHTPCCKARGLPAVCQELCAGNVTHIDFSYFKCLKFMSDYSNCLLQGYGVLPSSPTEVHVSNIDVDFAIIHWETPKTLGDTVQSYNVHFRMMATYDNDYRSIPKVQSPYVLEHLVSDSDYEVYVEAVNTHGVGEPSARLIFKTGSKLVEDKIEEAEAYNVTACCVTARLSEVCLPLCSYDASMVDIKALAGVCAPELNKLLRCGAGGRNHAPCCLRRGVTASCLPLCVGVIADSLLATATTCIPYIGNIVQCFEEGKGKLPGPIGELHATTVTNSSVSIEWDPPVNSNVSDYVVHYQKVDNMSMHETTYKLDNQMNVTTTQVTIENLESGHLYNIFVVSRNEHGTSLPSSQLMLNITEADLGERGLSGVTTPPHSLVVSSHSATWVTVSWQPPEFSHPAEQLAYRLNYKSTAEETYHVVETSVTSHMIEGLNPNTQYIVYVTAVSNKGQSGASETLIAWTDPAYPAFVEPPTVHPINLVIEGSTMTILCIAMGTPMPVISLYISGRLVRQETTRHMVTVIHNVTRDMDQISCYADNGYGTPMQASRKITISHVPHIKASGITMVSLGESVVLECTVDAHPEPKMLFWRDHSGRVPVIQGGKYNIHLKPAKDEEAKYIMQLTIDRIADADEGDYFCHAENAFGSATQAVSVRIRNVAATNNVTQCCIEQNVTSSCMDACSFYLDIDAVIDKPECINDFDKLMKCAADGSDHRSCCAQWGVPRRCLDWCRGEPLFNSKLCVLSYTKQIMSCFHEGRDRLPGPPQNVRVEMIDTHSVTMKWDPPVKNPTTVEMYRVFWRQVGARNAAKNDTKAMTMRISGLKEGATYECVIKAGNHLGTSTLTEPVRFTVGDKYITSAASLDNDTTHVGVAIGVILAIFIVAAIIVGAVWFLRAKHLLGRKSNGGVAFENPSYLREVNMDHIQVPQGNGDAASVTLTNGVNPAASPQPAQGWKHETLHVPAQAATEVAPSLYEELKLGHDGAGFKRLK